MAAGVNVAFGQDCVQDGFYPYGRGDMLEVALISAHTAHLATDAEQLAALAAVTTAPAKAWQLDDYGVVVGARADLQLHAVGTWSEVLRRQDPPLAVWSRGRQVASTTITRELCR
jgi:cytosine deaminase